MNGESFEHLIQALLEKNRRGFGQLIQFGAGPDGSREATWNQPADHPSYVRPPHFTEGQPIRWVFQVKFHDIGQRGWRGAADALISDLEGELTKLTTKHKVGCDHYVLATNIPLSGVRRIGTRDQITTIASAWMEKIPIVEVWDAVDVSRMLDNNSDVRTAYLDLILPGDLIRAIYSQTTEQADRRQSTFKGYLNYLVDNDSKARADEAGDEERLPLTKVFIDQLLRLDRTRIPDAYKDTVEQWSSGSPFSDDEDAVVPSDLDECSSSFVLLLAAHDKVMLLAGPGYGKSTITQFLALYHACRLSSPSQANQLALRLNLPARVTPADVDSFCTVRFPFRIELRRYDKWRKATIAKDGVAGIARYIAQELIGSNVDSTLAPDDIFALANTNPVLLILDGLDEVPDKESRDQILKDCEGFIYRCSGENADLQVVMSSRPQGYNGEFDRFEPLRWTINELGELQFNTYCEAWLGERIKNSEERQEAQERISRGMKSEAVRRLATTLLQATVMLTIVRRRSDIPEERHALFAKYVDVVFQREKAKSEIISKYESELLRLHEIVGYRLHEAIGMGSAGTMPEATFRSLVREVWHLLRGDQPTNTAPNVECMAIMQMTTDRLVFLSGKGDRQADVDFVIQPYREYFAAQYLNMHTGADPDKVFNRLFERGAFWANVLQFYVALAKPAQQLTWATATTYADEADGDVGRLLRIISRERATVATLPEYIRFTMSQFRKAITAAFPVERWWSWREEEWAVPILRTLKSGEGWRQLFRSIQTGAALDRPTLDFAIWLFPRVVPPSSTEFQGLLEFLSVWASDDALRNSVIEAVVTRELPIKLADAWAPQVAAAYDRAYARRTSASNHKVSFYSLSMSESAKLYVLCNSRLMLDSMRAEEIWAFMGLNVPKGPARSSVGGDDDETSIAAPDWTLYRAGVRGPRREGLSGPYAEYLDAVYAALESDEDHERHSLAHQLEAKLPNAMLLELSARNMLGPPPSSFPSVQAWKGFRAGVRAMFEDTQCCQALVQVFRTLGGHMSHGSNDWLLVFFHPAAWDVLVDEGLVSEDAVTRCREARWAKLLAEASPTRPLPEFVQFLVSEVHIAHRSISINALWRAVLRLRARKMLKGSSLHGYIFSRVIGSESAAHMEATLREAKSAKDIPAGWTSLIFTAAICTEGVDLKLVSEVWWHLSRQLKNLIWVRFGRRNAADQIETIRTLAAYDDIASQCLAASLCRMFRDAVPDDILKALNVVLSRFMLRESSVDTTNGNLFSLLIITPASVFESKIYANRDWFNDVNGMDRGVSAIAARRISEILRTVRREEFPALRETLAPIVQNRRQFPPSVALAALNVLIQVEMTSQQPLSETMWQTPEKD